MKNVTQCQNLYFMVHLLRHFIADNEVGGSTQDRPPNFYEIFDVAEAVVADPATHTDSSNPFVRTLSDIALQMKAKTKEHPAQYQRWTDAITGYVGGVELETWYRDFGQTPSLEEFIHMRRDASGVRVVLAMIEPTEGIAVPEEAWAGTTVPEATELGVDIVAWQNDRTSFPGEQRAGRAQLNMVTVIQHQRGLTVEEAMHEVAALCQEKWDRLLQLEYDLQQSNADPQILAYITGVKNWNYGYLQFVRRDPRYEESS